jgi:pimeloyl-ACP methyl ester carboxylesterase
MKKNTYDISPNHNSLNHNQFISKDEVRIHYVRAGAGKPILLLHGWPGFWYDWRHVLSEISGFCDAIAPDFRGFGGSDKPDFVKDYTPEKHVEDLIGLLDHLSLNNVMVVAHDIGATIAQMMAKKYPERISSIILLNPPYAGIAERRFDPNIQSEFWYQHFHNLPISDEMIGNNKDLLKVYLTHFYTHWIGRKEKIRNEELNFIIEEYSKPDAFKASILYYRARAGAKTANAVSSQTIEKINHNTKILWGKADPVMRVEWADRIPDYFSNVSIDLLEGIGHFVPFEAPEKVIEAIKFQLL